MASPSVSEERTDAPVTSVTVEVTADVDPGVKAPLSEPLSAQKDASPTNVDLVEPSPKQSGAKEWAVAMVAAIVMGLLFGTAFAKSRVFEPMVIRKQFVFSNFIMLKTFLGAMGTGALCNALMSVVAPGKFEPARKLWEGIPKTRGLLLGPGVGGLLLGVGMAVGAACPGMVMSQLGAGVPNAWLTLVGGLTGTLVYSVMFPILEPVIYKGIAGPSWYFMDKWKPEHRLLKFHILATALGLGCFVGVLILELLWPWEKDNTVPNVAGCNVWTCRAWPPSVAGILIGLLQVPAVLLLQTFLGSATSYAVCISCWVNLFKQSKEVDIDTKSYGASLMQYFRAFGTPNKLFWWQVLYVGMAVLATYLWSDMLDAVGKTPGISKVNSFVGGFVMLFGSRLAGGCTSGHGISGCAILMFHSFIAVPMMFAGGIATAFIGQAIDPSYV